MSKYTPEIIITAIVGVPCIAAMAIEMGYLWRLDHFEYGLAAGIIAGFVLGVWLSSREEGER